MGKVIAHIRKGDVNIDEIPKEMTFESEWVLRTFVFEKPDGGFYFSTLLNNPKKDMKRLN